MMNLSSARLDSSNSSPLSYSNLETTALNSETFAKAALKFARELKDKESAQQIPATIAVQSYTHEQTSQVNPVSMNTPASSSTAMPLQASQAIAWFPDLSSSAPKVRIKIQHIATLRVSRPDIKDGEIAKIFNMSQGGLSRIYALPEYHAQEAFERKKLAKTLDDRVASNTPVLHEAMRQAVPTAMQALIDGVSQTRDLKSRMAAAAMIFKLDPDRTFREEKASDINQGNAQNGGVNTLTTNVLINLADMANQVARSVNEGNGNKEINVTK